MVTRINSSESSVHALCVHALADMAKANSKINEVIETIVDSLHTVGKNELTNMDVFIERIEEVAEAHKLTSHSEVCKL